MKTKKSKLSIRIILVVILSMSSIFLVGFGITKNKTPNEMYAIYLEGKKIGTVASKDDFNNYINIQEEKLKAQYNVESIHTPKGVEIKKVITYSNKTNTNEEIYKTLVSS